MYVMRMLWKKLILKGLMMILIKSDLLLYEADYEHGLSELVELDPHHNVEHIYQVGKGEAYELWDSRGDIEQV